MAVVSGRGLNIGDGWLVGVGSASREGLAWCANSPKPALQLCDINVSITIILRHLGDFRMAIG